MQTDILFRKIINMDKNDRRSHIIQRNSIIGLACNAVLVVAKALVGLASGSVAVIFDAFNNASDMLSSLVTMLGYRISKRKPTHSHPLGFGRIEYISALLVSFIVLFAGLNFLKVSIEKIFSPAEVFASPLMIMVLSSTILIKIFLWRLNRKNGIEVDSDALKISGTDALSDALSSSVTVLAVILSSFTSLNVDAYAGLFVSLFVLYAGTKAVLETVSAIVGERPARETVQQIRAIIAKHPPLKGGYEIQIHNYGPSRSIGTINVEVPAAAKGEEIFDAMTEAQNEIMKTLGIYFTFGMYAVNDSNPTVLLMKSEVMKVLKSVEDDIVEIHAFHVHFEDSRVHFDVVVGFSVKDVAKFRNDAQNALEREFPTYSFQFNIDPDYS